MRSSKSRSRSKQNRPRTLGNIINRVFDSSGPEGKVRGTPQQIIEKYQMLARDAQLSNDRVAAENFLQHAEHYTRLLAEATREMAAEQEARQQYQNQNGNQNSQNSNQNGGGSGGNGGNGNAVSRDRQSGDRDYRSDQSRSDDGSDPQPYGAPAGFDVVGDTETGLVDLPEFNRQPRREPVQNRPREERPREERPREERPREERPREERPREERPREERPREERPREERPREERPHEERPRVERTREERPREERPKSASDQTRDDRRNTPRPKPAPRFVDQAETIDPSVLPELALAPAKAAPKPRPRKPAAKPDVPAAED
jgi:hypothetical protein